ncbi:SMP-30/gluconolactonase/LRE family protein [Sphingomonas cannabina]|uniref:SMP-30/gluconolactonase/LRE family protein n=1 Tax=Sphingomonas cannabina TaxID=2899123 RepID=UPI001F16BF24|nr:SMP-30/gluconolactonase/LRE family protein [Sphingomonas cannabina]UIJ46485.1 SMP-30/gluconolactonase/LRE family protein [Sphingomonas cannabina]
MTFASSPLDDMPRQPERIWRVGAGLAECPVWLEDRRLLAWVDIVGPSCHLLDPSTGETWMFKVPAKIGSAAPAPGGAMLLALEDGLWRRHADGRLERCASPDMTGVHFNDGKCDPAGRFWVGSRSSDGSPAKGKLFRFDPDGRLYEMASGFDVPNGLGWSPAGDAFYLVDTVPRLLYRYDYDLASGAIGRRRVIQDFAGQAGKPDGLAVDAAGNLWCAMWDGGGILVLSPEGLLLDRLPTPCPRPTSCAFGGGERMTLFVTSASYGLDPADFGFGDSGSIFAFRSPIPGTPVASMAGSGGKPT